MNLIRSETLTRALTGHAKYPLWKTVAVLLFGIVVNLMVLFLLRRLNSTDREARKKRKRSDSDISSSSSNGNGNSKSSSGKKHRKRSDGGTRSSGPNVLLLLGIPGSGKTTWLKEYVERCDSSYTVVSAEALRMKLTGSSDDVSREEEVRESMITHLVDHLKRKQNVVLDDSLSIMDETFRRRIVDESPYCNRYMKSFPIKAFLANRRIQKDMENAKTHLHLSSHELEEMESDFKEAREQMRKEGWKELLESPLSRSKRA